MSTPDMAEDADTVAGIPGKGVDLDYMLENEVGQFGRYQILTMALASLPIIFAAIAAGEYVFTTARIPTRCLIPFCDSESPEFAPSWILNAINGTSVDSFDDCEKFVRNSSEPVPPGTCPAALFDQTQTTECDEYVYENQLTVVYDFGLACDEWRRSQIGSIRTMGALLVLPITGFVSDRWGRRVALCLNAVNTAWIGVARSFVNSYEWFLTMEVLESAIGAGTYSSCYILVTELVGPKYRELASAICSTLFASGQAILGLIAWGVPQWRNLTRVLYAPQLLIICYFWILPESIRWLMSKGKYDQSEKILQKVAKTNKKVISDKALESLRETNEAKKLEEKPKEPLLIILVFRSKTILLRCVVSPVWWVTSTLVYYGMGINAVNLLGNSYVNYAAVAAVDIPGYWIGLLLLNKIGRKPVLIVSFWLCAACQFVFAFMPEGNAGWSLAIYLFGKFCIAIVIMSVYMYTAELYPTKYRHSLFAFSSMIGRIGSISAPLTPSLASEIWEPFPSVLFGSFALLSGLLMFLTPETLGTKLPDTIEEAEQIGRTYN